MAISALWGTDATSPAGTTAPALHANAFNVDFAQGITSWYGYGDHWMVNHGTIASWGGSIAGFTSKNGGAGVYVGPAFVDGTTPDSSTARAGESWTFTWITNCTISGTIIFTGVSASNQFLGTPTSSYSFVGTGKPTETWTG